MTKSDCSICGAKLSVEIVTHKRGLLVEVRSKCSACGVEREAIHGAAKSAHKKVKVNI